MDTYACSKGWETKWAEWKSDWLLEVINAHEAGECTDLDKREYIYHLQLIPPDKYDSTVEACVLNSREERRQAAKAEQRYCLDIPFRERSAKRQRTASQPPSQAAVQAALADVNKTLLKWLNKQQPSLNALVHIMDATHLVAFTSAFRIAVLVEGGLAGMVRRDGHQAGLSWDQAHTSIRVRDARQRPEAHARRHGQQRPERLSQLHQWSGHARASVPAAGARRRLAAQ